MSDQIEREDKYDVAADFLMPDPGSLPAVADVESQTFDLEAVYYDTSNSHLQRRRITLRHRTGGPDSGWHVKVPAGEARTEIHVDGAPNEVPAELVTLLVGVRGGHRLQAVARLRTRRTAQRLLTAGRSLVVEIADDGVTAVRLVPPARESAWREVEVEVGDAGTERDLAAAGLILQTAGARRSYGVSKLVTAMGQPSPLPAPEGLGGLVAAYVRTQVDALAVGDLGLRRGADTVYPMRVAVRRLRSTIRTFGPLLDTDAKRQLSKELTWLAGVLGPVRDHDVLARHFDEVAEVEPAVAGAARAAAGLAAGVRSESRVVLLSEVSADRYLRIVSDLDGWWHELPFAPGSPTVATNAATYVDPARAIVEKRRVDAARPDAPEPALHTLRKAYKRLRYALELAADALDPPAALELAEARIMQDLLGEHQDSVVALDFLDRVASEHHDQDFEPLIEVERRRFEETRRRAREALMEATAR